MTNVKKLLQGVKPLGVKNSKGDVVAFCIDIKSYQAMEKAVQEWHAVQKKEGVRWVGVRGCKAK